MRLTVVSGDPSMTAEYLNASPCLKDDDGRVVATFRRVTSSERDALPLSPEAVDFVIHVAEFVGMVAAGMAVEKFLEKAARALWRALRERCSEKRPDKVIIEGDRYSLDNRNEESETKQIAKLLARERREKERKPDAK